MKNKHLLVGRELGRKKWTLKIGAINVAIFGKYAADFGFLALVTLFKKTNEKFLSENYLNGRKNVFMQAGYD